jgi:hypothetical protein
MLSEHTVTVEWRKLFQDGNFNADTIRQAERLIERLPYTSPLRARLGEELSEFRALDEAKRETNAPRKARSGINEPLR